MLSNASGSNVLWGKFFGRLTELTQCESSFILITNLTHREKTHFLFSFNVAEGQLHQYVNQFNRIDTFNYLLTKQPRQVFFNQSSLIIEKRNFIDKMGFQHRLGFAISCNSLHSLNLCINRKQPFSLAEQQQISQLLQSLIEPLEIAMRSELLQKIYSQIHNNTQNHIDGYVIIDRPLNILFVGSLYTAIIDKFHCIHINSDHITFNNPQIHERLSFLIDNNQTASIHNQCDSWLITLIPVACLDNLYDWECFKEGFILTFTHDKQNYPIIKRLTNIHKLSRCEALCALDFLQTPSISEVAESSFRSEATVRNHIKHIMQIMEVHYQAALMKKLITLAAL